MVHYNIDRICELVHQANIAIAKIVKGSKLSNNNEKSFNASVKVQQIHEVANLFRMSRVEA